MCDGTNGTPNLSGRFLEGVTSSPGSTKSAGLPNITGSIGNAAFFYGNTQRPPSTGAFSSTYTRAHNATSSPTNALSDEIIYFDAHNSNSIYGNSSTVQPNSYTVLYIMKIKA